MTTTHTLRKKKNASSLGNRTFPAEHQSNPSLFPRLAFILLFVTKMINSHLAYYCTACCHRSCNYTILSFSAVSDPCREEDTAGSHGRGSYTQRGCVTYFQHICFYDRVSILVTSPYSLKFEKVLPQTAHRNADAWQ